MRIYFEKDRRHPGKKRLNNKKETTDSVASFSERSISGNLEAEASYTLAYIDVDSTGTLTGSCSATARASTGVTTGLTGTAAHHLLHHAHHHLHHFEHLSARSTRSAGAAKLSRATKLTCST